MEVIGRCSDVPDDDSRRNEWDAPHVLSRALESLADHLDVRLPRLRLDDVAIAVARVVAVLRRAASGIPVHVCDDDQVLRLLARADAVPLDVRQDEIHRLLEVRAQTLTDVRVLDVLDLGDDVAAADIVEHRLAVEGQEGVLELLRGDLRDEQTHRHADPVGRVAVGAGALH